MDDAIIELREIRRKIQSVIGNKVYASRLAAKLISKCDYNLEALNFLHETKTVLLVEKLGLFKPNWGDKRVNTYEVTLKNDKHVYSFNFYSSINDTYSSERDKLGHIYRFYDYLACLNLSYFSDFDDFCNEFGCSWNTENDYIRLKQVYFDVLDQDKNLRLLFTDEELERLSEIS
jgi:hypothetical protein